MLCFLSESGQVDTALCFCSQLPYSLYFVPLPCFLFLCCLALCFGCFALFWLFWFFFSGHVVFHFFSLSTHTLLLFVVFFFVFLTCCSVAFMPPAVDIPLVWSDFLDLPRSLQLITTKFILHRNTSQGQMGNSWVGFQLFLAGGEILALKSQDPPARALHGALWNFFMLERVPKIFDVNVQEEKAQQNGKEIGAY